jgi:type III pantothenate kinase
LVEGLVARIKAEDGRPMKVIATGGLAPLFADGTDVFTAIDADLTLRGLLAIYRANRPAPAA